MTQTTDQVLGHRRVLLGSFLLGWCAWYGFFFSNSAGVQQDMPSWFGPAALATGVLGWLTFAIAAIAMINTRRKYKDDPAALAALEDEITRENWRKAAGLGFYTLILVQVALVLGGRLIDLTAFMGGNISIFAGVLAVMGGFLVLDLME